VIRWSRRAAQAKAEAAVCDRTLQALLARARDVQVARLACSIESMAEAMMKHAPLAEIMNAETALADAVEAEDFASRVCRLLERPRREVAKSPSQEKPTTRFGSVQGGKR
jgi:hypothetical protein